MRAHPRHDRWQVAAALALAFWCLTQSVPGQEGFRVPADPPKCRYVIDASVDLKKGFVEGRQTVTLPNDSAAPIGVVALDWPVSVGSSIRVTVNGVPPTLLNTKKGPAVPPPLFYRLPDPVKPGSQIELQVAFRQAFEPRINGAGFSSTQWYPRLWWDGLPVHDAFSVKLDIPEGCALAISGRLNEATGRYDVAGARTFGIHLAPDHETETREVEGVRITTLFTKNGAGAASACMDTAVDAVKFYKNWLGFYPFDFLYVIPGGRGRYGGYPFATGIVVIHGQETFKEGESLLHWQRITAHEIGHEYFGEWVLDPDRPAWLWIGMGIFADTEYILSRNIDPDRRRSWMARYLQGVARHYDTTVDVPPAHASRVRYGRNNTVVHSKGFSVISALDSVLGRETFERIYKKCLRVNGGRRLSWREFQRFCEVESGRNLRWFFDQWVRSNRYLCYAVESRDCRRVGARHRSVVRVKRLGTMRMPVPVRVTFEDGTSQTRRTDRNLEVSVLVFESQAALRDVVLDPEHKLAKVEQPLEEISAEAAAAVALGWTRAQSRDVFKKLCREKITSGEVWYRLGMDLYAGRSNAEASVCFERVVEHDPDPVRKFAAHGWLGLLHDLRGERAQALERYRQALELDTGETMGHGGLRIRMNRKWVEERLKSPFTRSTPVSIPARPTAGQLVKILDDLGWTDEGRTPLTVFEKAKGLEIPRVGFWFKLGLLLFDSGDNRESLLAFRRVAGMKASKLYVFAAHVWMGHLEDLLGRRAEALVCYRKALELDPGVAMQHGQYGMRLDRTWVEKRLDAPFTWRKERRER